MLLSWVMQTKVEQKKHFASISLWLITHKLVKRFWNIESPCEVSSTTDFHDAWLLTAYMQSFLAPHLECYLLKFN